MEKSAAPAKSAAPDRKFNQLTGAQKAKFVAKLMLFIISFGFAFPQLLNGGD